MVLNIRNMMDDTRCFEAVREMRWPGGPRCPHCESHRVIQKGHDNKQPARQRYRCNDCDRRFDDLTGTIFAGHHQPLKVWILALYFMGLNLSNTQIARELGLHPDDAQDMVQLLRQGITKEKEPVVLTGEVEFDEVYIVAGHKGQPEEVVKAGREPRTRRLKGAPGRGTAASDKPPGFGMIQRGGLLVLSLLPNVQQRTIKPIITGQVETGTTVYTDEYSIYSRLTKWGYGHKTVCHSKGEYARDEDGDGFHEVHVNTMEGVWSLLRSWLRPHRGISQRHLPSYIDFFEFVHNVRRRGKALLHSLIEVLVQGPRNAY